ncbi:hypothetical protein L0128_10075 [candidate division KSB1 bacterium]|nr:hypothetical protein [candidate division KSB1 bacterium]
MRNLFIGLGFIIGGLSDKFVLRGTDSSGWLIVVGFGLMIWGIFDLYSASQKQEKRETETGAEGTPATDQVAEPPASNHAATTEPLNLENYCDTCENYNPASGACSKIHENVRSYPTHFVKKCNGKFFNGKLKT